MNSRNPGRINLKHLHYFHEVAREGSLTAAARRLHLALQTLSSQVRELEASLGRKLLERACRRLLLKKPNFSARPMSSIDTNKSGNAGIIAKLRSIAENMKYRPSAVSRLRGSIGAPLASSETVIAPSGPTLATGFSGCTDHPRAELIAATTMTISDSQQNRIAGSGSLLPSRSIASSTEEPRAGVDIRSHRKMGAKLTLSQLAGGWIRTYGLRLQPRTGGD